MELALPPKPVLDRPMTIDEFLQLPDLADGRREELFEGEQLVNPPPSHLHQLAISNILGFLHDLVRKRAAYERVGLPAYWIVDPLDQDGPTLLALELVDGTYVERSAADRRAPVTIERPFPVTVDPAR